MIETERLILRPWREEDAGTLYKYASAPAVGALEQLHHGLMVSLVVGYEYRFHFSVFLFSSCLAAFALRSLRRVFLTPLPAKTQ